MIELFASLTYISLESLRELYAVQLSMTHTAGNKKHKYIKSLNAALFIVFALSMQAWQLIPLVFTLRWIAIDLMANIGLSQCLIYVGNTAYLDRLQQLMSKFFSIHVGVINLTGKIFFLALSIWILWK